ncbi:hypothetical protein ATE84_3862 [Aquimarina sp. MAR_2010_214]|uniref:hypothetical protein n=1 Tax=Aquimarina sp. MAR_2010_214 TaxID=1250026 RepID=UPI000C70E08F|nr:hypothetical protein [Aquimarina sp. MAR_2010_214]PKV51764.1 hypothetical protein ATE84_3862 [Aquimarina sp. MAR_2010_214]
MIKIITGLFFLLTSSLLAQEQTVGFKLNDSTTLSFTTKPFDPSHKKFQYYDETHPYSIDGKPIFGTDANMPKHELVKAILQINETEYNLQVDTMYDPGIEKENMHRFKIIKTGPMLSLKARFSDGAGGYLAEWVIIIGGKSIRTMLTNDELAYSYFADY